jgi:hypothetical protein
LQGKVSKEEQNSDDPQTPTRAEPEADPDVFLAPTLQEKVSKEEQNSDDPPTPATAETEVFIAPTLDFLTSKALSYSMNPVLLTSPIAKEEYEPGFEVRTSTFKCSNFDLDVESSPYL